MREVVGGIVAILIFIIPDKVTNASGNKTSRPTPIEISNRLEP